MPFKYKNHIRVNRDAHWCSFNSSNVTDIYAGKKIEIKGENMTNEEAVHELRIQSTVLESMIQYNEDFEPKADNSSLTNRKNAIDKAITALEKQIPKLVKIRAWSPANCPTCEYELSEHKGDGYYKHLTHLERCPNVECSQRLKWNDE